MPGTFRPENTRDLGDSSRSVAELLSVGKTFFFGYSGVLNYCGRYCGHSTCTVTMKSKTSEAGFTLIEIMVTITCIAIMAALAVPRIQGYLLQSHLESAKSYLAQISARQRMYKITTGYYCCQGYNLDEDTLTSGLGINLADAGDYCFVFICQDSTLCPQTSGPGFITATTGGKKNQPDFEVWAILQNSATQTAAGPGFTSCNTTAGKTSPLGWVLSSSSASAGRAGQVVSLRYPPPANGLSGPGSFHAIPFDWHDGMSISDAMSP